VEDLVHLPVEDRQRVLVPAEFAVLVAPLRLPVAVGIGLRVVLPSPGADAVDEDLQVEAVVAAAPRVPALPDLPARDDLGHDNLDEPLDVGEPARGAVGAARAVAGPVGRPAGGFADPIAVHVAQVPVVLLRVELGAADEAPGGVGVPPRRPVVPVDDVLGHPVVEELDVRVPLADLVDDRLAVPHEGDVVPAQRIEPDGAHRPDVGRVRRHPGVVQQPLDRFGAPGAEEGHEADDENARRSQQAVQGMRGLGVHAGDILKLNANAAPRAEKVATGTCCE